MDKPSPRIFACSSRKDGPKVEPIVKLLRTTKVNVTLRSPAGSWRVRVMTSIDDGDVFVLFWDRSAARSDEVRRQYERGLGLNKEVVPVCLDDTPLPDELVGFQEIEFPDVPLSMEPPDQEQIYAAAILQRVFQLHFSNKLYLKMDSWLSIGGGYRDQDLQNRDSLITLQSERESGFSIQSSKDFLR
ncbi:MAG: toll/interleukin-1 receptor domain-containing protein [Gammaproteobacteria bacterium]|nr:toll/interleukin-1 receptor domain-containing protein [Gammaproteobacteria bacterium]